MARSSQRLLTSLVLLLQLLLRDHHILLVLGNVNDLVGGSWVVLVL